MNNEQLIEGLKQNTRGFFALSKEERECLEGHREWVELAVDFGWEKARESHELYEGSIYRLSPQAPAFQPEEKRGEWVEYKIDSDGVKYYIKRFGPNNERLLLSTLPHVVGFGGVQFEGEKNCWRLSVSAVVFDDGSVQDFDNPQLNPSSKPATPVKARFFGGGGG